MTGSGYAIGATGGNGKRRANDFYETPAAATEALLHAYLPRIGNFVWEPACGRGAISRVLKAHGIEVFSTDLVDRGYGMGGCDFLTSVGPSRGAIITNPPFALAEQFIRKAMTFRPGFMALLLKQTFWNAASRAGLWVEFPPADFRPLAWRLDFTNGGAPTMDCGWCVWGDFRPERFGRPLLRPTAVLAEMLE